MASSLIVFVSECFNPRAREGRDVLAIVQNDFNFMFQSTRP